jgi:hypothetical protein
MVVEVCSTYWIRELRPLIKGRIKRLLLDLVVKMSLLQEVDSPSM